MVADMTTIRRSDRASHAWRASAMPMSAWMLRSWNSSRTMVAKPESSGSAWARAVRMPSVASRTRVCRTEVPLESNLPADLAAERPAPLVGDSAGDGAGRDPPGLEHEHGTVRGERGRQPGGLARSGRGRHDDCTILADPLEDPGHVRVERKGQHFSDLRSALGARGSGLAATSQSETESQKQKIKRSEDQETQALLIS